MNPPVESWENVNCAICNKNDHSLLLETEDYHYGVPGTFSIVRCNFCGLTYINPRPTQDSVIKLYEHYYGVSGGGKKEGMHSVKSFVRKNSKLRMLWHNFCGNYLSEVIRKSHGKVLDIGCGSGDLLAELSEKGCAVYGVEPNPNAVAVCLKRGLDVQPGTLDKFRFADKFFDTVLLWHVLEHLPSPKNTLDEINRILKPGGKLFVYSPNIGSYFYTLFGKYWVGLHLPFHFYHFDLNSIRKLAATTNFQIEKIHTRTPEYLFLYSLKSYISNTHNRFLRTLQKTGLFNSLFFRFFVSAIFRILDFCLPEKGECLTIELVK